MLLIEERQIGVMGRVGIPASLRDKLDLFPGTKIGIYLNEDTGDIIIRNHESLCSACFVKKAVTRIGTVLLCSSCKESVNTK